GGAAAGPLAGLRVLVPRGGGAGERIAEAVRGLGGEPALVPLIEQHPPGDPAALAAAAEGFNRGTYDWVAITSAHGARAFVAAGANPTAGGVIRGPAGGADRAAAAAGAGARATAPEETGAPPRIAAVGPATAAALTAAGFPVDLIPAEFTGSRLAEHLAATILAEPGGNGRVLLPLSDLAEPTLELGLSSAGLAPERVTAYRTLPAPADPEADAALRPLLGAVLVLSSSGARALAARFGPLPEETIVVAIGQPTAAELARLQMPAAVVATVHTGEGAVAALADYVAARRSPGDGTGTGTRTGTGTGTGAGDDTRAATGCTPGDTPRSAPSFPPEPSPDRATERSRDLDTEGPTE
ncbi:uroporphyrinogen-III synthase, partial [Leucobacter albus]